MTSKQEAPKTYLEFTDRFPKLRQAWDLTREAESEAGFDEKTTRLIKLAIAIGAQREGAVHSAVRKALAAGATEEELLQVVVLSASTIGFPSSVAVFSWMKDLLER